MRAPRRPFTGPLALTAIAACALAVLLGTSDDAKPGAAAPPAAADTKPSPLARVAFLAGQWSSDTPKGFVEEHWAAPRGSSAMGMFRWCKPAPDFAPSMFEILTITAEGEDVLLRFRHYSPKLVAKEDKEAPVTLKLLPPEAGASERKLVFVAHANSGTLASVTYERTKEDRLLIEVAFTPESKREPLNFDLQHAPRPW